MNLHPVADDGRRSGAGGGGAEDQQEQQRQQRQSSALFPGHFHVVQSSSIDGTLCKFTVFG